MSRFALQIYAILLIMGAVPLVASAILLSEVLTFNDALQDEAVRTIDDVALFHRAWAESESDRVTLIGESLASSPELLADDVATPEGLERVRAILQESTDEYDVLRRAELVIDDQVLVSVEQTDLPPEDELKMRKRHWTVAQKPSSRPRPDDPRVLRLTFGIDRTFAERYDALGEKRELHRTLAAVEDEESGSISEVYRTFYYLMLALVVILTVAFAVLITTPISRRVARLAAATEKVARGDLSVRDPVKGRGELSQLTELFNEMVNELSENRRKLAYLERMSAWQQVARRLAHEIKNPLTPLLLAIQQLDKTFDMYRDTPERYRQVVTDVVEIVSEEVETLRLLTREFSEFARLPQPSPKPRDVWEFVQQTLRSNPQFEEHAELEELGGPSLIARLDPPLIRRVIVNVIQNAIEAVLEAGENTPHLTIALEHVERDDLARIIIVDNGPGLTDVQLERVFEPYFTTKETGTGLGLAIVRKIMLDHGGDIRLRNRSDGASGAEVWIDLPTLGDSADPSQEADEPGEANEPGEADEPAPIDAAETPDVFGDAEEPDVSGDAEEANVSGDAEEADERDGADQTGEPDQPNEPESPRSSSAEGRDEGQDGDPSDEGTASEDPDMERQNRPEAV